MNNRDLTSSCFFVVTGNDDVDNSSTIFLIELDKTIFDCVLKRNIAKEI